MRRLQALREAAGPSRTQLSYVTRVYGTLIGQVELSRLTPRPDSVVLMTLVEALGYEGDPANLLDEVSGDG